MTADHHSFSSEDQSFDSGVSQKTPLKKFVLSNIQGAIAISVTGAVALFGASTWNVWQLYQGFQTTVEREFKLQDLSSKIVYYDEVLTMSARMSASTANPKWEERYWKNEPQLTQAIETVSSLIPATMQSQTTQTDQANQKLIEMEEQAFKLVQAGQAKEALDLLLSPEYETQKEIYSKGIEQTIQVIDQEIKNLETEYTAQLENSLKFAGLSLPLLGFSIFVVSWLIRTYLRDRQQAERALGISQQSLVASNHELTEKVKMVEEKTQQIQAQEQATAQDAEQLHHDIENFLDVLAKLEDGDFTVEAEVSDRVTGLVADTLNRLVENLSATLTQVSDTANIASNSSNDVKNYAEQVATDVKAQADGVNQMLQLTDTVWESAQDAIAKIEDTQTILTQVKSTVEQGQSAINDMNDGIDVLQTGSDRMVQKIKTLGEFVSLADQFVQEQNQTAAMTQVLALNASLVAAKAAEQRDPEQFQQVAREFESIANQVQQLAQQANTSLDSLHKRTTKIHGVVADVDREVQGLNTLVSNFSQGVSESTEAFSEVQAKTSEVEASGKAVEVGNTRIVEAAENTRTTLRDISTQADRTTERMESTLYSSMQMKTISDQLIESIQVFSLPKSQPIPEEDSRHVSHSAVGHEDGDITRLDSFFMPVTEAGEGDIYDLPTEIKGHKTVSL